MATSVDDFKKRNPQWGAQFDRLAWLKEQESKRPQPKSEPKSKKGSGNQSWLSSIISELGGAGGAAGGAAAGAALGSVVPGIGNIVGGIGGGILGGFLGGTGGRLVENQVRDNEMRLADALKEGAWSGAFGAIGPAWQGTRGLAALGKAAPGGAKLGTRVATGYKALSGMSDDVAKATLGKAISTSGKKAITKGGMKSVAAKGIGAFQPQDDLLRSGQNVTQRVATAEKFKIPSGVKGMAKAERVLGELDDDIAKLLSGKSVARNKLTTAINTLYDDTGVDMAEATLTRSKNSILKKIANITKGDKVDLAELRKLRSSLGKDIFKGTTTAKKELQQEIYDLLGDTIRQYAKGTDDLLTQQRNILDLGKGLAQQSKEIRLPFFGASVEAPGAAAARDTMFDARIGLQRGLATAGGRGAKRTAQGALSRGLLLDSGSPDVQPTEGEQIDPLQQEIQAIQAGMINQGGLSAAMGGDAMGGDITGEEMPQSNNQFSPQNIQASVQQILAQGGDFDDVKKYLSIVEVMQELGGAGEPELTADQRNAQSKAAGLKQSVQGLLQNFEAAGGGQGVGGVVPSLLGRTPGVRSLGLEQQAQVFEDQRKAMIAPLARAISGEVGVLTDRDIKRAEGLLPRLTDPEDVAQKKIADLLYQIELTAGNAQPSIESSIQGALQQYQPY